MVVEDAHPRAEICITESFNDVSNTIVIRVTKGLVDSFRVRVDNPAPLLQIETWQGASNEMPGIARASTHYSPLTIHCFYGYVAQLVRARHS